MSGSVGRRTGVRVDRDLEYDEDDHMENPGPIFEAAKSPKKKPKRGVRFSVGADHELNQSVGAKSVARKMGRFRVRESIDTADLSTVSTAPLQTDEVLRSAIDSPGDFPLGDDDENEEEDDLVPPPPPELDDIDEDIITKDDEKEPEGAHVDDDIIAPDNDDEKDGPGFEMQEDSDEDAQEKESTPQSEARRRKQERLEKLQQKKKDKRKKESKKTDHAEQDDDDDDQTPVPKKKKGKKKVNRFATTFSPKGVPLPRTYKSVPVSADQLPEDDKNVRRSRRYRCNPLEFWRGEKFEYEGNNFGDEYDGVRNMPVVKGVLKPDPTPYKKRDPPPAIKKKANKRAGDDDEQSDEVEEYDATRLRKKYKFNDGRSAHLWDERFQDIRGIKVVSHLSQVEPRDLPLSKTRTKSEGKVVGQAAQSFNVTNEENPAFPGYIVGSLFLPPKGIKDAESVGLCAQVFTVVKGQPKSIELAYGDPDMEGHWEPKTAERFLLSVGDNFLVPPGNTYRLENHSKTHDCLLSWTIVRHNPGYDEGTSP